LLTRGCSSKACGCDSLLDWKGFRTEVPHSCQDRAGLKRATLHVLIEKNVVLSIWHAMGGKSLIWNRWTQTDRQTDRMRVNVGSCCFGLFIASFIHSSERQIVLFWNNSPCCCWKKEKVELVSALIGLLVHEKSKFERESTSPNLLLVTLSNPDHCL
jgi:hypothetical protein